MKTQWYHQICDCSPVRVQIQHGDIYCANCELPYSNHAYDWQEQVISLQARLYYCNEDEKRFDAEPRKVRKFFFEKARKFITKNFPINWPAP